MQKIFIIVSCGPEEQSKVTRAFHFAKIAAERKALVGVLLVDDAVNLARPEIADKTRALTGDALADHLKWLRDNASGCKFLACTPCCNARGIAADEFDPIWSLGTGVTAMDIMTEDGVATLTF